MVRLVCPRCAHSFTPPPEGEVYCPGCGHAGGPVPGRDTRQAAQPAQGASGSGHPPWEPTPPAHGWGPPGHAQPPQTNGTAVASLVTGIVGLCGFWFMGLGLPVGILAVVLGVLGLNHAPQGPGRGLAVAGIVLGTIAAALGFFFFRFWMGLGWP